ncbi:MAG: hypothetical protein OXH00_11375 [Candidatus Poribacteria bacterium]|nr:hypothetical protein [Candidatus Poribacteria bacterium]
MTGQTPLKVNIRPHLFVNVVKPNFTLSAPRNLQIKSVGFHSVSDGCGVSGTSCVFYDFRVFSGIRSTQPTGRYLGISADFFAYTAELPYYKRSGS